MYRQHNYLNLGPSDLDATRRIKAVYHGQADIHKHYARLSHLREPYCLLTIPCFSHNLQATQLHRFLEPFPHMGLVIGNQHCAFFQSPLAFTSSSNIDLWNILLPLRCPWISRRSDVSAQQKADLTIGLQKH